MHYHRVSLSLSVAVLMLGTSAALAVSLPRFPPGAVWYQEVSSATVHPASGSMIATLAGLCSGDSSGCGFGLGRFQIDFSIKVLYADAAAPRAAIVEHQFYDDYYAPDCDAIGSTLPLPPGGSIEGSANYTCDNTDNDCHLLVVQGRTLYEAYSANRLPGGQVEAFCLATWNLDVVYPPEGRGEHCTSADAAGFPIAPLLFNADEVHAALQQPIVADRHLGHAIRFILPNDRMASDVALGGNDGKLYVRPASHAGGPDGPPGSVPYGSRLRLRGDFPFANYSPAAQVILRTLQRYGMVLADGGSVALTAEADQYTTHKWNEPGIAMGSRVFDQTANALDVSISDFVVLDTGPRIPETYDCVPTNVSLDAMFRDGFE